MSEIPTPSVAPHETLVRTVLQYAAALGLAVLAGGAAFFVLGLIVSAAAGGEIDSSVMGLLGSFLFAVALVGFCGGVPGILVGVLLMHFHLHSQTWFVAAGVAVSTIVPLIVMATTPLEGWWVLLLAIPSGGAAGDAAWYYLKHRTTLLKG